MYEALRSLSFQDRMLSVKANEGMTLTDTEYLMIRLDFKLPLNSPKVQFDPLKVMGF